MSSHDASAVLESVMKSEVMKTLVTPTIASNAAAVGSSAGRPSTKVAGPPTSVPTVNLRAFGFGVLLISTAMTRSGREADRSQNVGGCAA
jgi:hypothetical protein